MLSIVFLLFPIFACALGAEVFYYDLDPSLYNERTTPVRLKQAEYPEKKESSEPPRQYKPEASSNQPKKNIPKDQPSSIKGFDKPTLDKLIIERGYSDDSRDPHKGLSLKIQEEGQVISSKDGRVVTIDNMEGYRNYVIVEHSNGILTVYGNLDQIHVTMGQTIKKGTLVGTVPKKKNLYFQLNQGEKSVDPAKFISQK